MKEFRAAIIRMHDNGVGNREIGRLLSISEATVRKVIIRYQETGGHGDRPGRGQKKTARSKKNIQRAKGMVRRNPSTKANSVRKLAKKLGVNGFSYGCFGYA